MALLGADEQTRRLKLTVSIEEIAGLVYHSVFDYPLKFNELGKWSVGQKALNDFGIKKGRKIKRILGKIGSKEGYVFFGNDQSVIKRKLREKNSRKKLGIAQEAVSVLSLIHTIKFVGITGSLAMQSADSDADIDLLVVCSKNTLWISRLLGLVLLKLSGVKTRSKNNKQSADRICTNMWLEEGSLVIRQRNIYTAHELVQILPILNRDSVHEKLIVKNKWTKDYWPNVAQNKIDIKVSNRTANKNIVTKIIKSLNKPAWVLQKMYMQNSITKESVSYSRAIFHPVNLSSHITKAFERQLKLLGA